MPRSMTNSFLQEKVGDAGLKFNEHRKNNFNSICEDTNGQ